MAGPQFFHLQSYSRKPNKAGQSIAQVLGEAVRLPEFSQHVLEPKPCRVLFGLSPDEVQIRHDEMVAAGRCEVTLKDGTTVMRGIRKDRHTLMTAVASHPHLTAQINSEPDARADYDAWTARNVAYLRSLFGDQLVSVIEHVDEEHPHIHAYILPLDDPGCNARDLNPCWVEKSAAEDAARLAGHNDKTAVKLGNAAYKARARLLQDEYHQQVGLASALTRIGPKRERLSRQQWRARKHAAVRDARLLQQMDAKVAELAGQEEALENSASALAQRLAARLDEAEALFSQAEAERAELNVQRRAHEKEATARRAAAEEEAEKIMTAARHKESEVMRRIETSRQELNAEKTMTRQRASREAADVVVRVIIGVLKGTVGLNSNGQGWFVKDEELRKRVQALDLGDALRDVVSLVSSLWERLTKRLSAADLAVERAEASEVAQLFAPQVPPTNRGPQP